MNITIDQPDDADDVTITSVTERRRWWLFGPMVSTSRQYRGSGTVWHEYPSGRRCSTSTESWLCDLWTRFCWGKAGKR